MKPSKALLATWNKKLRSSGFDDIEAVPKGGTEPTLKQYHSLYFMSRKSPSDIARITEYYDIASTFLHTHRFTSAIDKSIWGLFAAGLSENDITNKTSLSRTKVNSVLRRLRKECYGSNYPTAKGNR